MWCDIPAVNFNYCLTGGSTVHTINIEIRATAPVSPEIPTSVFVISLHSFIGHNSPRIENGFEQSQEVCARRVSAWHGLSDSTDLGTGRTSENVWTGGRVEIWTCARILISFPN